VEFQEAAIMGFGRAPVENVPCPQHSAVAETNYGFQGDAVASREDTTRFAQAQDK